MELEKSSLPNPLLGGRFLSLAVANALLHVYVFSMIPLIAAAAQTIGAGAATVGYAVLAFAAGMVLPGPLGAYMMERRSRKGVCLRSMLFLSILPVYEYNMTGTEATLVLFHGVQGLTFGIVQTALGTTLVNDVLPSRWRSPGDNFYAWAGRIGIPLGIALGFLLQLLFPLPAAWLWSLLPCVVAFLLVAQTEVPLKAPVKVPLLTLDRFVWPGSWRLSLTMFAAPWLLGRVVAAPIGLEACLLLVGGTVLAFLWALLARERFDRLPWFGYLSYVLLLLALCLPKVGVQPDFWPMFVLLGFGVGNLSARHLQLWIWQAEHCQRGTAQNTYMLSWRLSFAVGFAATACWGLSVGLFDVALCTLCFLFRWFFGRVGK